MNRIFPRITLTDPFAADASHPLHLHGLGRLSSDSRHLQRPGHGPDLPARQRQRYYRGTRFDWSGVIYSLTHDGHEYFGEWQESDDPYLHDRITGPVDSFGALGYRPGEPGATFVRIGVGVCRQPDEEDFRWNHTYRIVDHGGWTVARAATGSSSASPSGTTAPGTGMRTRSG